MTPSESAPLTTARWEPAPARRLVSLASYPWLVVATTCAGAFIGQVDASIVQIALPEMERAFGARLGTVTWVALAYQLAFACSLPIFARLADLAGRKAFYLAGFALFAGASTLCALSHELWQLVAARFLLGVGGAMLGANSLAILTTVAGTERRAAAMGVFAAAQAVGVSLGPAAGGVLVEAFGWRSVFWVNVPFAAASTLAAWLVVPQTRRLAAGERFDLLGAAALVPALAFGLVALSQSDRWGLSPALFAAAALSGASLALFLRRERRTAWPLIDPAMFRSRSFAGGLLATAMGYAALYGLFLLMAFALVRGFGESPSGAGFVLAVVPVAIGLVAPFSGRLVAALGLRLVLAGSMVVAALAVAALALVLGEGRSDRGLVIAALAVAGAGLGAFIAPNSDAAIQAAPQARTGSAGGLVNLMRMLGCSLGVAGASTTLAWLAGGGEAGVSTLTMPRETLLAAVKGGLGLVAVFALVGAAASLLHDRPGGGSPRSAQRGG